MATYWAGATDPSQTPNEQTPYMVVNDPTAADGHNIVG